MTRRGPIIRNIYVMLAYAFRSIRPGNVDSLGKEDFDHLHDLFAEILARGMGAQIKRGLDRGYVSRCESLPTVRGRIDVGRSAATLSLTRAQLVSRFDEYEVDTPHNRALKAVVVLLIRHGEVGEKRKAELRRLLPYLDDVALVSPRSIHWRSLTVHRANASYRFLLAVCELVVKGLLPVPGRGEDRLMSWLNDEAASALYERFLRRYFAIHHPELSPRAEQIPWDLTDASSDGADQLPRMQSDVVLRRGGRTLIIDAKFYSSSMQTGRWDTRRIHSANLYQIQSYVKNADTDRDGSVSGLLLYARTDSPVQPDLDVVIQGNRIGAQALDLSLPWSELRAQLDAVPAWLDPLRPAASA